MASRDDSPGGRRRRPPPTIDLKAREIPSEEPAAPVSEPSSPSETPETAAVPAPEAVTPPSAETAPEAAATAETPPESALSEVPAPETAAPEDTAPERPHEPSPASEPPPPRRPSPWPAIVAGLGGAGAMLVLFLALWNSGAFVPDDAALNAKVAGLEKELRALAARPAPSLDAGALNDLAARIDAAEQATRRFAERDARIGRAETAATAPRAAAADPALANRVAGLDASVKALNESLADLRKRAEENSAAMRDATTRAAAAESAVRTGEAVERREIDALGARVAAIETSLKAIDARRNADAARDKAVRFAVAAGLLRVAVERGEPYAAELAAVRPLADPALLKPLEPFAEKGLPSREALARELGRLAPAMQDAATTPKEGGLMERLQANAERLVRIRPVNETTGDDPVAVVSRAEAKAQRGDLGGARADLARLPEPARAPASDWMKQSEMRAAAVEAARKLAANALDALGKAGN
jgi:hypothetical protein